MKRLLLLMILGMLAFAACKDDDESGENPFAHTETPDNEDETPIDSTSIQGLHKTVFATTCATPSCHDGSFEPDFRTVESTYATLLWHSTIKPDPDTVRNLRYRVVPYEPDSSWLWERLITNDTINLGRMPSNGWRLPQNHLDNIRAWIEKGAPGIDGEVMQRPNFPPQIGWYQAFDEDSVKLHEIRAQGWASPFLVSKGRTIKFWFYIEDDSTAIEDLRNNRVLVSTEREDFSNATEYQGKFERTWTGWWTFEVPTVNLKREQLFFFRIYTKDPSQSQRTEYPTSEDPFWLQDHYSFYIY